MKLIALLCLAGILLELTIDKVDGSCLQNTPCTKCGRGARCVFGLYCTAFCITATIAHEERYRKYCPRLGQSGQVGQYNPFGHLFSKRSVSHSKRSTDTVKISYKEPFLEMMDDVREQIINGMNLTAITTMFTEIAEDVKTNELASIANLARRAAAGAAGLESRQMSEHDRVGYIKGKTIQIFDKFTSLDDSNIECEVEESSPLAKYGHGNRYGYDPTRRCSACPPSRPHCIGRCAVGSCSGTCSPIPYPTPSFLEALRVVPDNAHDTLLVLGLDIEDR